MQDLLDDFGNTIKTAADRLAVISEPQSQTPRAAGKWSPKEIIGHLIDSAANNHLRFVLAQFRDDLIFPGYEQEEWVRIQSYQKESWEQLVQLWKHYNLHLLHLMSSVDPTSLKQPRTRHSLNQIAWQPVAESEPVTLEYFMRDYVAHLQHHLSQILGE